jgi:hypothetical protein
MTARGTSKRWTCAECSSLARQPVHTVPAISAGAPTSYMGPILAPAETAASHIDIQQRLWYNRCKSAVVATTSMDEQVSSPSYARQFVVLTNPTTS